MAPLHPIFEFQVHPSVASLTAPLGRDVARLERLAESCDDASAYDTYSMVIRGKRRLVAVPVSELDAVHRRISTILFPVDLSMGPAPNGYVARRSTLTNAAQHVGAQFLQKFDIKSFFASTTSVQISDALVLLGFGREAANLLSRLTCRRMRLPLGARTSPRISNIVLMELDDRLASLAVDRGLTYTRYADDMTFSSQHAWFDVEDEVATAVVSAGFELNNLKTRSFKRGQPMFVTGLSVEDRSHARVRKRLKARLRQEFYYIEKFGIGGHAAKLEEREQHLVTRLAGQYRYCAAVEPDFASVLAHLYPNAYATLVPRRQDDRADRARRHRDELVSDVRSAPALPLPIYQPSVSLR
ncbi:reverse transcriptase family protein [Microbacterium sp. M4A5_1d]